MRRNNPSTPGPAPKGKVHLDSYFAIEFSGYASILSKGPPLSATTNFEGRGQLSPESKAHFKDGLESKISIVKGTGSRDPLTD